MKTLYVFCVFSIMNCEKFYVWKRMRFEISSALISHFDSMFPWRIKVTVRKSFDHKCLILGSILYSFFWAEIKRHKYDIHSKYNSKPLFLYVYYLIYLWLDLLRHNFAPMLDFCWNFQRNDKKTPTINLLFYI